MSEPLSPGERDAAALLEDLRIHQSELEAQNIELRESREAGLRSERRLRTLFQAAPLPYIVLSDHGIVQDYNRALLDLLGTAPKRVANRPFVVFVRPEYHQAFYRHLADALAGTGSVERTVELVDAENGVHEVVLVSTGEYDEHEAPICITAVLDRTALKKYRGLLQEQSERYERLLDHVTDVVLLAEHTDATGSGRIVEANTAAVRLLGYESHELIGRTPESLSAPDARDEMAHLLTRLMRERRCLIESRLQTKGGDIIPVEVSAGIVTLGGKRHVLSVIRDISARRQAEERLVRFRDVLDSLRRASQVMLYETDIPTLVETVCRMLVTSRGYINAWAILYDEDGAAASYHQHGMGKNGPVFFDAIKQSGAPECVRRAAELDRVVELDIGGPVCADCPAQATHTEARLLARAIRHDGVLYGVIAAALSDGSHDDELERSLFSQLGDDMAFTMRALEDRRRRDAAAEQIRELLHERELMARELQHRVKNDYALVQALLSLQSWHTEEEAAREAIDLAAQRVETMVDVQELLLEAEDGIHVSLIELVERIVAGQQRANIVFSHDPDGILVGGAEAARLGIACNELCTNAIKYAGDVSIEVRVREDDERVSLEVHDGGPGFPDDVVSGVRSGFGLDMVRALVESSGGELSLENSGSGATVRVEIPVGLLR